MTVSKLQTPNYSSAHNVCSPPYRSMLYFSNLLFVGRQLYRYMDYHSPTQLLCLRRTFVTKQRLSRAILGIRDSCHLKDPRFIKVPICRYVWQPQTQLTRDYSGRVAFFESLEPNFCQSCHLSRCRIVLDQSSIPPSAT